MRVAVVGFHALATDSRVLRTAEALQQAGHEVLLIGHGPSPDPPPCRIVLLPDLPSPLAIRAGVLLRQAPATVIPATAPRLYWLSAARRRAREVIRAFAPHVVHANDWSTLPLAIDAKRRTGARIVYDTHEMAVAEYEHSLKWRLIAMAHVGRIERDCIREVDAIVTVSPGIAAALRRTYPGIPAPAVVRNVPSDAAMPFRSTGAGITVLFHGLLRPNRGLEATIDSLPHWHEPFRLLLRGQSAPAYLAALKERAERNGVSRRVSFEPPVPPHRVVAMAADADIGTCLLPDSSRQNRFALPNKLFEYLAAGLAVIAAPLPDIAEIVRRYGCGLFAEPEPTSITRAINGLDRAAIDRMKQGAVAAAGDLTWAKERERLTALYDALGQDGRLTA